MLALHSALASSNSIPRWDPRARLGLNLGPSPTHARNVHLVLSLSTGLVSPQFHCRFDDFFETCKYGVPDGGISSTWQRLAGFKRSDGVPVLHTEDGLLGATNPAQATPQDTAESHSFSVTSAQNEEGISNEGAGVSFSDTDFEALQTVSPNRRHNSDVTLHAFRVPTRPSTTQHQRGTSSNRRRNSVTPVTHTVPPVTPSPHAGISTREPWLSQWTKETSSELPKCTTWHTVPPLSSTTMA